MTPCREIEPLLAERASGDLAPGDAVRLEAHLADCPRCRRELAAYEEALELARVPSDRRYDAALAGLGASTLAAWKRGRRRRAAALALGAGLAAAAASALLALSPGLVHRGRTPAADPSGVASAWEPDVDSALAASSVLDAGGWYGASASSYGSSSYASASYASSDGSAEEVVLAAFDEATQ